MEYLVGFIVAIFSMLMIIRLQEKNNILNIVKIKPIQYSQSHIHSIVAPLMPKIKKSPTIKKSQASIHESKHNIKVIIMNNSAYWIKDNIFYMADMSTDGTVNKDTTRKVDTMAMDKVQLDKMMFIVDQLREGQLDDSGNTGN